jgi:hypothetical protein
MTLLMKIGMGILVKIATESALTELLMFGLRQLAASTKTKVDDDLVAIVEKHLA